MGDRDRRRRGLGQSPHNSPSDRRGFNLEAHLRRSDAPNIVRISNASPNFFSAQRWRLSPTAAKMKSNAGSTKFRSNNGEARVNSSFPVHAAKNGRVSQSLCVRIAIRRNRLCNEEPKPTAETNSTPRRRKPSPPLPPSPKTSTRPLKASSAAKPKSWSSATSPKTGKRQFLAANVVPKTPKNNVPGTVITRAMSLKKTTANGRNSALR